uniref:UPF3 domain-containing protein n=1 Tax=Ditylenchus dipsaci TaxID=166011 RepID=A0A915DBB9_9BILA
MPSEKIKVPKKTQIKIVVRRLPHGITQEELLQQLDPVPEHKMFWFCKADLNLIPFAFSRAYFVFSREEDAIAFVDRFNGYVFVDKLGHESMGIVELAPYQEIIDNNRSAKENDKRVNTIEEDTEYIQFLKEYNSAVSIKPSTVDEMLSELEEKHKRLKAGFVQRTPLTDFVLQKNWMKEKKQDRRQVSRVNRPSKEKEVEIKKEIPKKPRRERKEHSRKEKTATEEFKKEGTIKKVFTSILKNSKKPVEDGEAGEEEGPSTEPKLSDEYLNDDSAAIESSSEKKFRPFKIASRGRGVLHKADQSISFNTAVEEENKHKFREPHERKNKEKSSESDEKLDKTSKPERAIYKPPSHRTRSKPTDRSSSSSKPVSNKDENAD